MADRRPFCVVIWWTWRDRKPRYWHWHPRRGTITGCSKVARIVERKGKRDA